MAGSKKPSPIITKEEAGKLPDYLVEMINKGQINFEKGKEGFKAPPERDLPRVRFVVKGDGSVAGKLM